MAATSKRITQRYWNSLEEGSRYRCLRKVLSNFSDDTLHTYAKLKAREMGFVWEIVQSHVKQPIGENHYKTIVDRTWIP